MLFAVGDQKLQHLVHRPHEEDDPQLGHPHGNQTPQEDGREHRVTERNGTWVEIQIYCYYVLTRKRIL